MTVPKGSSSADDLLCASHRDGPEKGPKESELGLVAVLRQHSQIILTDVQMFSIAVRAVHCDHHKRTNKKRAAVYRRRQEGSQDSD